MKALSLAQATSLDERAAEPRTRGRLLQALTMRRRQLILGTLLSTLSGICWFLACPTFDLWPLAFVAMIPVLFAIERATSTRQAALYAWCAGIVGNAGGFYWVLGVLSRFGDFSLPIAALIFFLVCCWQGSRLLAFGLIVRMIRHRSNAPLALVAPLVMVTIELCLPFVFQYYLAIAVAWHPRLLQIADLTGVLGVTALLLMVNGAAYDVLTRGRGRMTTALVTAAIVLAALGYGQIRMTQLARRMELAPKARVGIVQTNRSSGQTSVNPNVFARGELYELQTLSADLERRGADLIIWPESSYSEWISRRAVGDAPESRAAHIRRGFTTPLVFNATTYEPDIGEQYPYNSALMLDRDGRFSGRFDKNNLLMFGEYTPGRKIFPWLQRFALPAAGELSAGEAAVALPFRTADGKQWRVGPMICLEDILPAFGREVGRTQPHLLVNLTNDSWFGDTSEPWQHLALSVYRSIEQRTSLVRATRTGVSAYLDPTGHIYAKSYVAAEAPRAADTMLEEVPLIEGGDTIYTKIGDSFGYLCALLTFCLWLLPRRSFKWRANN